MAMPRSKFGKRLLAEIEMKREVEAYEGGCFPIYEGDSPIGIICRDPEYGYGMYVMAEGYERVKRHEAAEIEMGHRVGAYFEIADDAYLSLWHSQEGGRFLAALRDCPGSSQNALSESGGGGK